MNEENLKHLSLPVMFSIDDRFNDDKFIRLKLTFAHDGKCAKEIKGKKLRFTIEKLVEKKDSLFLSPVLGSINENKDGTYSFGEHDIEFRRNPYKENQIQTYYLENILGIIPPEQDANFTVEQIDGRNYVSVYAYLYKKYSNFAEDILKQYDEFPISMEIDILRYYIDTKDEVYDIVDFVYEGITILGQDIETGMIGANGKFFSDEQKVNYKEQLFMMMNELKFSLERFNTSVNISKEEGGQIPLNEDIKTTEAIPAIEPSTVKTEEVVTASNMSDTKTTTENEVIADTGGQATGMFMKTFSLSHDDIRVGLYQLLAIVEEADNTYYWIDEVFDTYFDYVSDSYGTAKKIFRQSYVKSGESVQFVGDRTEMFVEKLTADEKNKIETLRTMFNDSQAELQELRAFKANADLEVANAAKDALFANWSEGFEGNEVFAQLSNDKNNYSVEEFEAKCQLAFAKAQKEEAKTKTEPASDATLGNFMGFSSTSDTKDSKKDFEPVSLIIGQANEGENLDDKPYGGLLDMFN